MSGRFAHFKLQDFIRPGEAYHYARTTLTADNVARSRTETLSTFLQARGSLEQNRLDPQAEA